MKHASDGIAQRLHGARKRRDQTMAQLADKSGVNQTTISSIELGKNYPGTLTVEKLARALEVDPCWLAYGTGKKPDWVRARTEHKENDT